MSRSTRRKAVGAFSCGNCVWFTKAEDGWCCGTDGGAMPDDMPCATDKSWWAGDFEPVDFGQRLTSKRPFGETIKELDAGEILLVRYLVEAREDAIKRERRTDLKVGMRVQVQLGGVYRQGVITKIGEQVSVRTDNDVPVAVLPGAVQVLGSETGA